MVAVQDLGLADARTLKCCGCDFSTAGAAPGQVPSMYHGRLFCSTTSIQKHLNYIKRVRSSIKLIEYSYKSLLHSIRWATGCIYSSKL